MDDTLDPARGGRAQHHRGAAGVDPLEIGTVARPELGDAGEMIDVPDARHRSVEALRIEDRARHEFDVGRQVVGRRQVEHPDLRAARAQRRDDMAPDETRSRR